MASSGCGVRLDIPWLPVSLVGLLVIWYGGYRSIDSGAKLLVAETGILVLLAAGVLLTGGAHGLSLDSFAPGNVFDPGEAVVLAFAFAAFTGFESTVTYRREVRDPERPVPRVTYLAVGFLGLLYAFIVWIVIQAFGNAEVVGAAVKDPGGLFFSAITTYVGSWAADLMHIFIITSVLASLLASPCWWGSLARRAVRTRTYGRSNVPSPPLPGAPARWAGCRTAIRRPLPVTQCEGHDERRSRRGE